MSRPKTRIVEGDGDHRHGSEGGYSNHLCRCELCRKAHASYAAARREARPRLAPDDERHGTVGGYTNWRCKCPECRAAAVDAKRDWEVSVGLRNDPRGDPK